MNGELFWLDMSAFIKSLEDSVFDFIDLEKVFDKNFHLREGGCDNLDELLLCINELVKGCFQSLFIHSLFVEGLKVTGSIWSLCFETIPKAVF